MRMTSYINVLKFPRFTNRYIRCMMLYGAINSDEEFGDIFWGNHTTSLFLMFISKFYRLCYAPIIYIIFFILVFIVVTYFTQTNRSTYYLENQYQ